METTTRRSDSRGRPIKDEMLNDKAWVLKLHGGATVTMARRACSDDRYSWVLTGQCPNCSDDHALGFWVGAEEVDPDEMARRLLVDTRDHCDWTHQ